MSEFVIITGLSGAGRSQAADALEDLGWFVIDNLPSELIPKVAELVLSPGSATPRVAWLPLPIAIARLAFFSESTSFTPSPIIAT